MNYITNLFLAWLINLDTVYVMQQLLGLFCTIVTLLNVFCCVNGLGLFLLSVQIGYRVLIGKLDPTLVVTKTMMNKYEIDERLDHHIIMILYS